MNDRTESAYYAFRHFDPDNARTVLSYYQRYFASGPVLELACGTGVFLELLRDADIEARGVDVDSGMVDMARSAGHDVILGDALGYLRDTLDSSLQGLFAAHFLEHLPAEIVQDVYIEAARVLAPGGVFVAVVPNPACLSVLGYDFWRDPTHVRFYDPVALQFFAEQAGLTVTDTGGNPQNHPGPPPHLRLPDFDAFTPLAGNVVDLVQHANWIHRDDKSDDSKADRRPGAIVAAYRSKAVEHAEQVSRGPTLQQVWAELGHVVRSLDDRVQLLQHELAVARSAHDTLLDELYPANEVYVVAAKPNPEDAH
ncbi:MAG: class I SAM-dependent methyltransferase [Actinomycetota bacterium]